MKVICIGNFPPRQCGIATFTENLVKAMLEAAKIHAVSLDMEVIAMNDCGKDYAYPPIVKNVIRNNVLDDYIRMASYINHSGATICLLQHEFGIFGGESGVLLLALLRRLKIPLISTFHTILQKPSFHQHEVMKRISAYSSRIVVMNSLAIGFLQDIYAVPARKIYCIEHGVPDFEKNKADLLPTPSDWKNRRVMLTFGLIGRSKGIETAIRALPAVVSRHPEILYVVLGKTHPHILHYAGEEYRDSLQKMVKDLNLENNVQLVNDYVNELELMSYLRSADLYVTPYLNKAQITSGTLSYAVGGGCAVISTPYWHAEELLANGRGHLFDFGDINRLAEIVNLLLDEPEQLLDLQTRAYDYGKTISWPLIGKAYLNLFVSVILPGNHTQSPIHTKMDIRYPEFSIAHLARLTDHTGLLQHARSSVPYFKAGYCLDDNARAIIVCLMAWNKKNDPVYIDLIYKYLAYLTFMQHKDGGYANYLTYDHTLVDDTSDDAFGRVYWALGMLIQYAPQDSIFRMGLELFEYSLPQIDKLTHTRGFANCILGLYHYLKRFPDQEKYLVLVKRLADKMCDNYLHHKKKNWHWFEDKMTYDNGILPAALYRAYESTGEPAYLQIADESRIFLESKCLKGNWLSLIGNRRWLHLDQDYEMFAQQPIDAMAVILLYESALKATGHKEYASKIHYAFDWFFGKNDLNISLYNPETKGCHDGIEEFNINLNQGAESNIAYLISWLITEKYFGQWFE
jgi:glycosyltransferase involved in cell wall biosynthesis